MTAPVNDDEPLDPKVEAIRQKMVRLLVVSGGIMMVGLVTVLVAIVYKLNEDSSAGPAGTPVVAGPSLLLKIPEGSTVTSSTVNQQGLVITLTDRNGAQSIRLYNGEGAMLRTFEIQATE